MTVDATTPALARPRLDVGLSIKGGWNAFTADIVPLLVGGLIAGLLSIVTLGILAGPLFAGLYNMVVGRIRDGRPAQIGDVFSCMDRFWGFLWAAIVLVVLIGLASLTIVGGVLLATIWLYVFPFMVDRKMGLAEAMTASYHQVVDNGFWEHLALVVIFIAIGAVANGWLAILSTPFTIAVTAAAYFVAGGRERPGRAAVAAEAGGTSVTAGMPDGPGGGFSPPPGPSSFRPRSPRRPRRSALPLRQPRQIPRVYAAEPHPVAVEPGHTDVAGAEEVHGDGGHHEQEAEPEVPGRLPDGGGEPGRHAAAEQQPRQDPLPAAGPDRRRDHADADDARTDRARDDEIHDRAQHEQPPPRRIPCQTGKTTSKRSHTTGMSGRSARPVPSSSRENAVQWASRQ